MAKSRLVDETVRTGIVLVALFVEIAELLMWSMMWGDAVRCMAVGRVPVFREFTLLSRP